MNNFLLPSPVERVCYRGLSYLVKRDDQIHQYISGNKARKLQFLLDNKDGISKTVHSFGGIQSNMLSALSVVCAVNHWKFQYYTKSTKGAPPHLDGNLKVALDNGANIVEVDQPSWENTVRQFKQDLHANSQLQEHVYVAQGAHQPEAEEGIATLAKEIASFFQTKLTTKASVFLPSGTGTTAFYLAKNLREHGISVITCPVVGSKDYLIAQMRELAPAGYSLLPEIIDTPKKYRFGHLYAELINVQRELKAETSIEFDLVYDPVGWLALDHYRKTTGLDGDVMYIHCGGTIGNITMIKRYERFLNKKLT